MTLDMETAPPRRQRKKLTDIDLAEISIVDQPANTGARQLLFKNTAAITASEDGTPPGAGGSPVTEATVDVTALTAKHAEAVAELTSQIAYLSEKLTTQTPPGSSGGGADLAHLLAKANEDADRRMVAALAQAKEDADKRAADAVAIALAKQKLADDRRVEQPVPTGATLPSGDRLLTEALERARAEARRHAVANPEPLPSGYWRGALALLGARLEPDLNPHGQMRAALQSEEGKMLSAAATGDMRRLSG